MDRGVRGWGPALGWLLAGWAVVVAPGCAAVSGPFVWARDLPLPQTTGELLIQPRDTILVHAANQKDISGEFVVRDDGNYLQPPIGTVDAAGRTPAQLAQFLGSKLQGMIVNTQISVSVPKRAPIRVNVIGEVKTPAAYELERDRSVAAALAAAGWLNDFAAEDKIFVIRAKENPPRIRFTLRDLKAAEEHSALFQLRDADVVVVE